MEIVKEIKKLVKETCEKKSNYFGGRAWAYHISSVVDNAKILAEKLNADKEVVELAALLHDYSSVLNKEFYSEHHIHSARLAEEILKTYNYPQKKIEMVKHCIFSHRASKNIARETKEAQISSHHQSHRCSRLYSRPIGKL